MVKQVYLFPGFGASELGLFATGEVLWWDPSLFMLLGIGAMRLAPNGTDPGPPDGQVIGVDLNPQNPWGLIRGLLNFQLGADWNCRVVPYDWRKDIIISANETATAIRGNVTADNPATLVGHSMGGLLCTAVWRILGTTNQQNLVRRIITICSPFQGSYGPISWLNGGSPMVQQILNCAFPSIALGALPALKWTLGFLNGVALTWPSFYELFPGLGGSEAINDPNRALLYNAANYPAIAPASAAWLGNSRDTWQPYISAPEAIPPNWVATCVYGTGFETANKLNTNTAPLDLSKLGTTMDGDAIVTIGSAQRTGALNIGVQGNHSSVPGGIAISGQLADMIRDPRGPITPPAPSKLLVDPIGMNVTDPPEADDVTGLVCIGGHC